MPDGVDSPSVAGVLMKTPQLKPIETLRLFVPHMGYFSGLPYHLALAVEADTGEGCVSSQPSRRPLYLFPAARGGIARQLEIDMLLPSIERKNVNYVTE